MTASSAARRFHPEIRGFYERLREKGKSFKVALVACMRKLLIILNETSTPDNPPDSHYHCSPQGRGISRSQDASRDVWIVGEGNLPSAIQEEHQGLFYLAGVSTAGKTHQGMMGGI